MTLRRSQRLRYPLHRTFVAKVVPTFGTKDIKSNDDGRSGEEETVGRNDSPFVVQGCLVDFHNREDRTRMYTIRWDPHRRKRKRIDTQNNNDCQSPLKSELEKVKPNASDTDTELWTESRVTIGVLLHRNMGLNVAKAFEKGYLIGQVTNVYSSCNTNDEKVFYRIKYKDGPTDDFEEKEFQKALSLYHRVHEENRSKEKKGIKVAKKFDTGVFIGSVREVIHDGEDVFYNIAYDDGDSEDFDERELQQGTLLYSKMQKEKLANEKISVKIAKQFDTDTFVGHVRQVVSDGRDIFYNIAYDDGDSEDFDEKELQIGELLYQDIQKQKEAKRYHSTEKEVRLIQDATILERKHYTTHSFGALYDDATPIHTLILGTHPAEKSLSENRYFSNPTNVFWWIAGDCLGFRRDRGEKSVGGRMKICEHLRYDESHVIPYKAQIDIFCKNGFALWDIIARCQRKGSLDRDIKDDKPNDIQKFVEKHPTIKTIVMANGKSGLNFFKRHFRTWLKSGKLILLNRERSPTTDTIPKSSTEKLGKAKEDGIITCICAPSVSPAHILPYEEKRDFWDAFVYSPGLKLHGQLAAVKKVRETPSLPCTSQAIAISPKNLNELFH